VCVLGKPTRVKHLLGVQLFADSWLFPKAFN
jgi:hypothetical protein